jgi:hypothetical protein
MEPGEREPAQHQNGQKKDDQGVNAIRFRHPHKSLGFRAGRL